ncbi:MAG: DUF3313 domain-containing protein [Verrucomicrobiales bacterium]
MSFPSALLSLPLCLLFGCETTEPEKRNHLSSYRGMETKEAPFGNKSLVREADPETLKRYTRVIVEEVKVYPSKNTDPKVKQATKEEGERLAAKFEEILKEELGRHFEVTRHRSSSTLAVRAALTELRPSNPELFVVNYLPYAGTVATGMQLASKDKETLGAGSATVEVEVVDSRSRRQIFAMVDQLKGNALQPGGLEKWGQAEGAMRLWSRRIRRGIQANAPKPAAKPETTQPASRKTEKKASNSESKKDRRPFWVKPGTE